MTANRQAKVNGIDVQITDHQLVKLFSIPNFDNKKFPCVYADTSFLGNAAAAYLKKNILIYADYNGSNKNCEMVGIHVATELTPDNNIMLRRGSSTQGETGYNHFDIITEYTVVSQGQGGSKKRTTRRNAKHNKLTKRTTKRNAKHNINTKRLSKRNTKHNKNIKTKRKSNK